MFKLHCSINRFLRHYEEKIIISIIIATFYPLFGFAGSKYELKKNRIQGPIKNVAPKGIRILNAVWHCRQGSEMCPTSISVITSEYFR